MMNHGNKFVRPFLENLEGRTVPAGIYAVGAPAGALPLVNVYQTGNPTPILTIQAYNNNFSGGVRVATGDVNNDGTDDIFTIAGPGGGPHVKIFNGVNGQVLHEFMAYDTAYRGSGFLASGDLDNDGHDDLVIGTDIGGGPHVKVINGSDFSEDFSYFAYNPTFRGGVRVSVGQVDADPALEIITAAGPGGAPHVQVYDSQSKSYEQSYFAYDRSFMNGIYIATGDTDGDGRDEIITGAGQGGGPHVKYHDLIDDRDEASYFAYAPSLTSGVYVASASSSFRIGYDDVITAPASLGSGNIRVYDDHGDLHEEFFDHQDDGDSSNDNDGPDDENDGSDDDSRINDGRRGTHGVGGLGGDGGHD